MSFANLQGYNFRIKSNDREELKNKKYRRRNLYNIFMMSFK